MTATITEVSPRSRWRGRLWLTPSLVDVFFLVLLLAAFGRPQAWQGLLGDGDTGWHIRTGDFILTTGTVPQRDLFSFSRPDQPWLAWEWLADVSFALAHRWHGLEGVTALSVTVLCGASMVLLSWLLRRGVGLWIGVAVALAAFSASSVHHLARPHIYSVLLMTLALWILDQDRERPGRRLWVLVPLSALWANLHGGFAAWLATLVVVAAVSALERNRTAVRRYGLLLLLSSAATLLNPYGWRLHRHIFDYLGSSWIQDHVQEFQSPNFRSENTLVFAVLLLVGIAVGARAWTGGRRLEVVLVVVWGIAALRSARHIPLYCLMAGPLIAAQCAEWWAAASRRHSARSPVRILWELSRDLGQSHHVSLWTPFVAVVAVPLLAAHAGLGDFPAARFPVAAVTRNLDRLRPTGAGPRVMTSDQWADYLIYRFYPRQRVFFDGRSDFYGPELGTEYQALLSPGRGWRPKLDRYGFDLALLPVDWPLGALLENDGDWRVLDRDAVSVLLARRPAALKQTAGTVECKSVGE